MKLIKQFIVAISLLSCGLSLAETPMTKRVTQISNDKVNVWRTVIYPAEAGMLKMHRHEHDRVVVALDDGVLKVMNDQGHAHYLKLKKGESYFLQKDTKNELHTDENMTKHPISVVVIELK